MTKGWKIFYLKSWILKYISFIYKRNVLSSSFNFPFISIQNEYKYCIILLSFFSMKREIIVNDTMQKEYIYFLTEPMWENFEEDFHPQVTPKEMLELWVFGWKYMTDCRQEFPEDWFENAKLSLLKYNAKLNFFGIRASMPLAYRQEKWWIYEEDPRWRFQRYCRYYLWRRIPEEDRRQIKRRKAFKRHLSAVRKNCYPLDRECRKKQRQALLHRAYDSRRF